MSSKHGEQQLETSTPSCFKVLSKWLDHGAPLGFTEDIEATGVFPLAEETPSSIHEDLNDLYRSLEG